MRAKLIDKMGTDLTVVNAARVSFAKAHNEFEEDKDTKLINYLARHKHLSPFGHCFATFHVKAPMFVARQLVKHKFLRWNEVSRRYVDQTPEFYLPNIWRGRSEDKKQGSDGESRSQYFPSVYASETCEAATTNYRKMIAQGVCPEQARMLLPLNTYTEWYWSGSLDAWSDMCVLRCAPDTQEESRKIAEQISYSMGQAFPISWRALQDE